MFRFVSSSPLHSTSTNHHLQHKPVDVITIFHRSSSAPSTRALALLKQYAAQASETATVDQASDHSSQNKIQRSEFQLDVSEQPPTGDQLRNIWEYVGEKQAKSVVKGATGIAEAIRLMEEDRAKFQAPVVSSHLGVGERTRRELDCMG